MKFIIILVLSSALVFAGCSRSNAKQRELFSKAAAQEVSGPGDAAELYRKVVAIDATSELGRAALDRALLMEKKGAEMRAEAERRIASQMQTLH